MIEGVNLFFTADLHLGHGNIIRYCNRPFVTVWEMNEAILKNINDRVAPNDILWIIGDFCFTPKQDRLAEAAVANFRSRILCQTVHLIAGNHDPRHRNYEPKEFLRNHFTTVTQYSMTEVQVNGYKQKIFMIHYAGRIWPSSHHGVWQLWGHSHSSLQEEDHMRAIDVGIDAVAMKAAGFKPGMKFTKGQTKPEDYRPLTLNEIDKMMAKKTWKPIDHHGDGDEE